MTPEQKHRIAHEISNWNNARNDHSAQITGDRMADLLQELIEAPAPEPVARVTGYYAGYLSIATVDGRVLPAGTALYAAPPAPSVPDVAQTIPSHDQLTKILNGLNRCVSAESRREFLRVWIRDWTVYKLAVAPTPAEAPAEVARDAERYRWLRRKICFSGNGDGTASMYVINLPNSARFPDVGQLEAGADEAIDAAIERDKKGMEA